MATINGIYVFVEDEEVGRSSDVPQHPTEKGLPITDNVRNNPVSLSISGKIVDTSQYNAATILSKLDALRKGGSLIKYIGRNAVGNFLIKSFDTSHPNTNWGGADFSMELVEVRIAQSAYDPSKQKKAEEEKKQTAPVLEVGAIVVFKGGSVYVSSDASQAAATRSRSTCKITKINNKSWSKHDYHLISTDGKKVYGWVDKANIEGTGSSGTSGTTNGGGQQVTPRNTGNGTGGSSGRMLTYGGKIDRNMDFWVSYINQNTVTIDKKKYFKTKIKDIAAYLLISNMKNVVTGGIAVKDRKRFEKDTIYYRYTYYSENTEEW